jgi:hypothetical protein
MQTNEIFLALTKQVQPHILGERSDSQSTLDYSQNIKQPTVYA